MALTNCPECQQEISDSAMKCPKCGVQLQELKRGFFGKICKWSFILFNVFMAWWMFTGMGAATDGIASAGSDAEQAGAAIGTGLGFMMLLAIWLVGDVVLGLFVLFTRPKAS